MTCTNLFRLSILVCTIVTGFGFQLILEPSLLSFKLGENASFTAKLKHENVTKYHIPIKADMEEIILSSPLLEFEFEVGQNLSQTQLTITSNKCGVAFVTPQNVTHLIKEKAPMIRVTVFKYDEVKLAIIIIGWVYFVCWTLSFYPQIITNFQRKSVVGFNFDFLALNFFGHFSYTIFNVGLFWIPLVKDLYFAKDPHGVNPVQFNDVLFSLHAVFATIIQIIQCFIYERGGQRLSITCCIILSLLSLSAITGLVLTQVDIITYLTYLYFFSYVKLGITFIKHCPQVYTNYKRQSTDGFSVGYAILDFIGGALSILQMLLICYNFDDWASLKGDISKFGLGSLSMTFDLVFMFQHFVLYRHKLPIIRSDSIHAGYKNFK